MLKEGGVVSSWPCGPKTFPSNTAEDLKQKKRKIEIVEAGCHA